MNRFIDVPSGGAWFEGHFPGRPILPGVAQIALVMDELARAAGHALSLRGITFARMRQIVLPGDRLEILTRESEAAQLRFDLKRGDIVVANGELAIATAPIPGGSAATSEASLFTATTTHDSGSPALDDLLPHRPPMRFLTAILRETEQGLGAIARIPGQCALVRDGHATPVATIEAAAQAAAAWEALRRRRQAGRAGPRIGYLVALREIRFFTDQVPADRDLLVSVSLDALAPPLTHYRIDVTLDGRTVTRGTIATFLADA